MRTNAAKIPSMQFSKNQKPLPGTQVKSTSSTIKPKSTKPLPRKPDPQEQVRLSLVSVDQANRKDPQCVAMYCRQIFDHYLEEEVSSSEDVHRDKSPQGTTGFIQDHQGPNGFQDYRDSQTHARKRRNAFFSSLRYGRISFEMHSQPSLAAPVSALGALHRGQVWRNHLRAFLQDSWRLQLPVQDGPGQGCGYGSGCFGPTQLQTQHSLSLRLPEEDLSNS